MISISTKTGDQGETGLANGQRLSKSDSVFAVVGTLDELNSWLGLIVAKLAGEFPEERDFLLETQDMLFHLGAEIAQSPKTKLTASFLVEVERRADSLQQQMADDWFTKFVLPGGTELAAYIDITRTVCRRAERELVLHSQSHPVRPVVLKTLNRFSDYLFIFRSLVNHRMGYQESLFFASNQDKNS